MGPKNFAPLHFVRSALMNRFAMLCLLARYARICLWTRKRGFDSCRCAELMKGIATRSVLFVDSLRECLVADALVARLCLLSGIAARYKLAARWSEHWGDSSTRGWYPPNRDHHRRF